MGHLHSFAAPGKLSSDVVVDADGINFTMGEFLIGHPDKPTPTEYLAYRLLLKTKDMMEDPWLQEFVADPKGQLRGGAGFACWYLPFPAHLRGVNEMIVNCSVRVANNPTWSIPCWAASRVVALQRLKERGRGAGNLQRLKRGYYYWLFVSSLITLTLAKR